MEVARELAFRERTAWGEGEEGVDESIEGDVSRFCARSGDEWRRENGGISVIGRWEESG